MTGNTSQIGTPYKTRPLWLMIVTCHNDKVDIAFFQGRSHPIQGGHADIRQLSPNILHICSVHSSRNDSTIYSPS